MSLDNVTGPAQEQPKSARPVGGDILTITASAADRIRMLLGQKSPQPEAVMISVKNTGCSGFSYDLQYLDRLTDKPKFADQVTQHGVTVVVDPKATLFLVGSVMDYKEDSFKSGFDFVNPNETGRCGCGESVSFATPQ